MDDPHLRIRAVFIVVANIAVISATLLLNHRWMVFPLNFMNSQETEDCVFSVMTFNLNASESTGLSIEFQDNFKPLLFQEKPDILCIQEISDENLNYIKPLIDSLYGYCGLSDGDDQLLRFRVFSRYPIRNITSYRSSGNIDTTGFTKEEFSYYGQSEMHMSVMSTEIEACPGRWVTVFGGHLRSSAYSTARRSMDAGSSWISGIPLYIRNYKVGKLIRDYEADNIKRFIDNEIGIGHPVIVAGDLNDWCGSACLDTIMGDNLKDAWWEGGDGFGWTYLGWHLRLRLDHILYSDDLELTNVHVVNSRLSDHRPLVASFRLKN